MVTKQQQQVMKFGKSTIIVHSNAFEEGYSNGFLSFPDQKQTDPVTDTQLSTFMQSNLLDKSETPEWNAGYILGAVKGLFLGELEPVEEPTAAPQVPLGPITLHLNHWQFRVGFATGQEDYEAGQSEREPAQPVTAHDLLRYIAHRDPKTKRYYFAEEEINALEETLGQFAGYLCAALFPRPKRTTEPLQQRVTLQEA